MTDYTHILYLRDYEPVCANPDRLGSSAVFNQLTAPNTFPCVECSTAVFTHNKRVYLEELRAGFLEKSKSYTTLYLPSDDEPDDRGFIYGIMISSILWITIGIILWTVYYR